MLISLFEIYFPLYILYKEYKIGMLVFCRRFWVLFLFVSDKNWIFYYVLQMENVYFKLICTFKPHATKVDIYINSSLVLKLKILLYNCYY